MTTTNSFGARAPLKAAGGTFDIFRLDALERRGLPVAHLPYSLRILLENLLRRVPEDGSVEIAYFGLFPNAIGQGLGKHLLSCAVRDAWALGPSRVWLHTCTLDHPAALPNYKKRGFLPYKTETYEVNFPS